MVQADCVSGACSNHTGVPSIKKIGPPMEDKTLIIMRWECGTSTNISAAFSCVCA